MEIREGTYMERGDIQRKYIHIEKTVQRRDYRKRENEKHKERRLHGKRTTQRRKKGHIKQEDIYEEPEKT